MKINLYAVVPDANLQPSDRRGVATFVSTRKDAGRAVTDRNKDGTADEVKRFAPSLEFVIRTGSVSLSMARSQSGGEAKAVTREISGALARRSE